MAMNKVRSDINLMYELLEKDDSGAVAGGRLNPL